MCDTLSAAAKTTIYQGPLFAKNSDRPPNESQYLAWLPAQNHPSGKTAHCTYIEIPQVDHTYAALISKPFWMWGAEMGVNQHGLAIGNEAVFSRIPANKRPALLGMDLLRLGLERAKTALEAVDVITNLLEEHGQGGNCFHQGEMYYHNSFLMADPYHTWVLETIDQHWAARQVHPIYSISNILSLENQWDRSSVGFKDFILKNGLEGDENKINIQRNLSDWLYTTFSDGNRRCSRSAELLDSYSPEISLQTMAVVLRDHRIHPDPATGVAGADICMHASFGPIRVSQSTGSMIALLSDDQPIIFATGTSAPCTGIFKPFWVDAPPSNLGGIPNGHFNPETLFWSHERLHREVLTNYPEKIKRYQNLRDSLEDQFIKGALALRQASREERKAFSEACLDSAREAERDWLERVSSVPKKKRLLHSTAWQRFNRTAGFA